uniref:F-box protein AT5G49610-like beta-propeller domain-containing protein n=1 Tax=Aegilops tauschii TaxID=37682 RepID=M8BXG3_AEGTA
MALQLGLDYGIGNSRLLSCRHGLLLMLLSSCEILVWEPFTGDKHLLAIPPRFVGDERQITGAVLRAPGVIHPFLVVLLGIDKQDCKQAIACVYSSETGEWGSFISTLLSDEEADCLMFMRTPDVLVGDSLFWLVDLDQSSLPILEFDLHRQTLTVIPVPPVDTEGRGGFMLMRAEGGGLGFLFQSGCNVQLWKRKIDSDGDASWVLGRTFELDKILSLNLTEKESTLSATSWSSLSHCSSRRFSCWNVSRRFLNPTVGIPINHSNVSSLQKDVLLGETMELSFCLIHKIIFQLDMLFDLPVEQLL